MVFSITFLRALAACIITNAHYTGIYPTDLIANGGLLGDILFFAVSGYCLYDIKLPFHKWYTKRLLRIYTPVTIITLIYVFLKFYVVDKHSLIWWFIYPTYYHFIASIVILYVPYYLIIKNDYFGKNIGLAITFLFGIYIIVYLCYYDKSFYHIDSVHKPMIRFLFLESMLMGAWFRNKDNYLRDQLRKKDFLFLIIFTIMYFYCKLSFTNGNIEPKYQVINQIALFCVLFYTFKLILAMDIKLQNLPLKIKTVINFISDITLEIYLVQYVIIDSLKFYSKFPWNWFLVTITIVTSAILLNRINRFVTKQLNKLF